MHIHKLCRVSFFISLKFLTARCHITTELCFPRWICSLLLTLAQMLKNRTVTSSAPISRTCLLSEFSSSMLGSNTCFVPERSAGMQSERQLCSVYLPLEPQLRFVLILCSLARDFSFYSLLVHVLSGA